MSFAMATKKNKPKQRNRFLMESAEMLKKIPKLQMTHYMKKAGKHTKNWRAVKLLGYALHVWPLSYF